MSNKALNIITSAEDMKGVQLIAFEVYCNDDRYVGNTKALELFTEYCAAHKCAGFLGVEHNPDGIPYAEGMAKPHRHGALWIDKTANHHSKDASLDYDSIVALLNSVCIDAPNFVKAACSLDMKKALARYSCHYTASSASKEQFDMRNPLTEELELDEYGRVDNGLVNIYDATHGFIEFGNCSYINLITKTVREKAQEVAAERSDALNDILNHIYQNYETNYTDLMRWAMERGCVDTLCTYNHVVKNVLSDMRNSRYFRTSSASEETSEHIEASQLEDKIALRDQWKRENGVKKPPIDVSSPARRRAYAYKALCAILSTCSQQYSVSDANAFCNDMENVALIEACDTFMIEDLLDVTNKFLDFCKNKYVGGNNGKD